MLQKPIGVFSYGDKNKAQNIIVEVQKDGKNFLVGLYINSTYRGIAVNNIRTLFPKDLHEWLFWIDEGRTLYLDKEKVQNLIAQQRIHLAEVNNLGLNSINNIIQNFENPSLSSKNPENSSGDSAFSLSADSSYADKTALHQTESQIKITDELLHFRDLPRGQARDNASETAVRQLLENNVAAFPEKSKRGFVKFFESLVSFKPPKGMLTITAENFVTSATTAGLLRKDGGSAYLTIGDNFTLHYDHNLSTVEEVAALEKKSGGASLHTGETDAAAETAPTATDSTNNISSPDSKVNPTSAKNPENSSGDSAFSLPTAPGDTSLSPIDYRRSIDPLFAFVMEYTDNSVVNPGREHEGEYFLSVEFIQMLSQ